MEIQCNPIEIHTCSGSVRPPAPWPQEGALSCLSGDSFHFRQDLVDCSTSLGYLGARRVNRASTLLLTCSTRPSTMSDRLVGRHLHKCSTCDLSTFPKSRVSPPMESRHQISFGENSRIDSNSSSSNFTLRSPSTRTYRTRGMRGRGREPRHRPPQQGDQHC